MRLARCRKGVSTVIATILMINVAFATGILVFSWAQGLFGSWASTSGVYFQTKGESVEETIVLVNLRFVSNAYYKLNITVRNIGHRDVWIASIYLNNTNVISQVSLAWNNTGVTVSAISSGPHAGTYPILYGDAVTFSFRSIAGLTIRDGSRLTVVAATQRGVRSAEQWQATG